MASARQGRQRAPSRTEGRGGPAIGEQQMRTGLFVVAAIQFFTGVWLAVAPGSFVDTIASFGNVDHHFLRDISTAYLAMGAALVLSIGRPSWRVPILFLVTVQYALHTVNHLIDIGGTDPAWQGYADFVSLLALTVLLGWLLAGAARAER
jgi:hypothetical protein